MYVIKRNGRSVEFDESKISLAISKAFDASGEELSPGDNYQTLASRVSSIISTVFFEKDSCPIEKIQDTVEHVLMGRGYHTTAKKYILYREERTAIREKNSRLMGNLRKMFDFEKNSNSRRENANIDGDSAMGSMLKFGSETAKEYVDLFVLKPEHAKAHKNGDIHIHDEDFLSIGTATCTQIDLSKLFKDGFSTGHGFLREPGNIRTASAQSCIAIQSNQNEQHGGQSIPNFDRFLAPYVAKSYRKCLIKILQIVSDRDFAAANESLKEYCINHSSILDEAGQEFVKDLLNKNGGGTDYDTDAIMKKAVAAVEEEVFQAMEAFIHNLNTMHSRAGAQVPFSSINYGTDTSPEGRMIVKNVLLTTFDGLGNGETPIFPIQIFRVKKGINLEEGTPNHDLFKLACKVSAKRLFPNFSFQDAPFNLEFYDPARPETEIAYMGCRTRVMNNVNGPQITYSRGNLSFTSINLPRIGIEAKGDWEKFYDMLDERLELVSDQLLDRFEVQASKLAKNFPFLASQGLWLGSEKLSPEDSMRDVLKNGTLAIGFIGLAETLVAMTGVHHGESAEAQSKGLEIIQHMRSFCDRRTRETHMNFGLLATPAEGLSGRFLKIDREKYGVIKGITDREYYTNSFHVPVYYSTSIVNKLATEGPYHALTNGGHISYIEVDGDLNNNLEAFEKIVGIMAESGIGYGAINHPVDRDPICGYTGVIDDVCPKCGRHETEDSKFDRIRRITGYLVGTLDRFNDAKRAEVSERIKHR